MKKNNRSFEIALSGISCAVAVAFLSLGILSGYLTALGYFVGIIALMLPLSKGFIRGGFLAYAGTLILTLIMGAAAQFWNLVPFAMFFGLHPVANALQVKYKINRWLALAVKIVWFDCTLIAGYFLIYVLGGAALPEAIAETVEKYLYLLIFTVGSVVGAVYDFLIFRCQRTVDMLMFRIKK